VTHQSIGNFVKIKKLCTSLGQKGENRPPEPNNGVWVPKVWDYKILRYFRKLPKKIESWWISRKYSI
jgi:hypothetical protein